jgi:hypothetical protein
MYWLRGSVGIIVTLFFVECADGFSVKREIAIYFTVSMKKHFILFYFTINCDFGPSMSFDSLPKTYVSVKTAKFVYFVKFHDSLNISSV